MKNGKALTAIRLLAAATLHATVVYLLGDISVDGVALAWVGPAIMAAATIGSALMNKGGSAEQVPLETPEQTAARRMLLRFAETGQHGDFKAGAEVPMGYGDYRMTDMEGQGQSALSELLKNGIPDQYRIGDEALSQFLKSDPTDVSAQFDPFRAQVQRQMGESDRALKRGAGFAGNLYSTNTIKGLGDVQARGKETMTSELARLTDSALNRRLQAIPLAYQSAESQQNNTLGRIGASQQYGALTRQLNDQQIKARDAELLRRRQELQLPIQALGTVVGSSPNYGVPSVQTSPYQDLLGMVGQIGGQYASGYAGAAGKAAGTPSSTFIPPPTNNYVMR